MNATLPAPAAKVKASRPRFVPTDVPTPVPNATARRLVRSAREVAVIVKANALGQELLVAVTRKQAMAALKLRPRIDAVLVSECLGAIVLG